MSLPLNTPVKLTHVESKYVFPVEVVIVECSSGDGGRHYNLSLARNRMTHVRVKNDCLYLNGGPESEGAHFEADVRGTGTEPQAEPALRCAFRIKNTASTCSYLGVGLNSEQAGGYGGKYGDVAETPLCVGGAGSDSEWLVEPAPFTVVPQANQLIETWDEAKALTLEQKASFVEQGYLLVPGAVPPALVDAAREAIDAKLDAEGGRAWYMQTEGKAQTTPELLALFWDAASAAQTVAQSLLGQGNATSVLRAQLAIRFPEQEVIERLERRVGPGEIDPWRWHVDGVIKGQHSPFTLLLGVALSDIPHEPADHGGGFVVFPGSHITLQEEVRKFARGEESAMEGDEESGIKESLPGARQVMARKGDIIVAHQKLAHTGGPNGSDRIRYCVYFRVSHVRHEELKEAALEDIWLEFEGVR